MSKLASHDFSRRPATKHIPTTHSSSTTGHLSWQLTQVESPTTSLSASSLNEAALLPSRSSWLGLHKARSLLHEMRNLRCPLPVFRALWIGPAVPRQNLDLRVISVEPQAINCAPSLNSVSLSLCLTTKRGRGLPIAICLNDGDFKKLSHLERGMGLQLQGNSLSFESAHHRFSISLNIAVRHRSATPELVSGLGRAYYNALLHLHELQETSSSLLTIGDILKSQPNFPSLQIHEAKIENGRLVTHLFAQPIRSDRKAVPPQPSLAGCSHLRAELLYTIGKLGEAWLKNDSAACTRALHCLVGLGQGRTPTGDDFLCGFLAGVRGFQIAKNGHQARKHKERVHNLEADLTQALINQRTSLRSATCLSLALKALYPEQILALAHAIARDQIEEGPKAIDAFVNLTRLSGLDFCSGYLYSLALVAKQSY